MTDEIILLTYFEEIISKNLIYDIVAGSERDRFVVDAGERGRLNCNELISKIKIKKDLNAKNIIDIKVRFHFRTTCPSFVSAVVWDRYLLVCAICSTLARDRKRFSSDCRIVNHSRRCLNTS